MADLDLLQLQVKLQYVSPSSQSRVMFVLPTSMSRPPMHCHQSQSIVEYGAFYPVAVNFKLRRNAQMMLRALFDLVHG